MPVAVHLHLSCPRGVWAYLINLFLQLNELIVLFCLSRQLIGSERGELLLLSRI
jgi:hypothetical protein